MRLLNRLRTQRVVVEAVEVTLVGEVVLRPDALQRFNELTRPTIAFIVLKPVLADCRELALEPAAYHVDADAPVRDVIDRRDLLGNDGRIPRSGQDRGKHLELRGRMQQRLAEGNRLVLIVRAIAGGKADLAQRVVEAGLLGGLRELLVVFDAPVRALLDRTDHEATADIGHPVGELQCFLSLFLLLFPLLAHDDSLNGWQLARAQVSTSPYRSACRSQCRAVRRLDQSIYSAIDVRTDGVSYGRFIALEREMKIAIPDMCATVRFICKALIEL